ncbi:MAG: hypothetical protein L0H59_08900 [Tomitella sp.]|nr:hypothetical protein [Tomitella sp.]
MAASDYFTLVKACGDCPFRPASPIPLSTARRRQISDALMQGKTFFCHKTVDYAGTDPSTKDSARCYGAAATLYKTTGRQSDTEQIGTRLGIGDVDVRAYATADTYPNLDAFVAGPTVTRHATPTPEE